METANSEQTRMEANNGTSKKVQDIVRKEKRRNMVCPTTNLSSSEPERVTQIPNGIILVRIHRSQI